MVYYLLIFEVTDLLSVLVDLTIFIAAKVNYFDWVACFVVALPLYHSDGCCLGDHSDHNGRLNAEEDIVSSDYLGVDVAVGQSRDGWFGIVLQLVDERHNSQDVSVPEELFPAQGCALLHFSLIELFIAKANAPEAWEGQFLDELVISLNLFGGVVMNHFGTPLDKDEVFTRWLLP